MEKILITNPGYDLQNTDYSFNEYALTKYYKRLLTLEKIENE